MKIKRKMSFLSGIVFFILGIIIFLNPETVIKFVSYCFGGVLILVGLYKSINYYIQDKRLGVVNRNELAFGITAIVLGLLFIFLAGAIELLLRFIVGGWLVIAGLSKIFTTFYTTDRTSKFYALIVVGLLLIAIGLYIILVSNLALSIIGLFMMIYGLIDFVSYFVYERKLDVDVETVDEKVLTVEEAEVVEVDLEESETNTKKSTKKKNGKKDDKENK